MFEDLSTSNPHPQVSPAPPKSQAPQTFQANPQATAEPLLSKEASRCYSYFQDPNKWMDQIIKKPWFSGFLCFLCPPFPNNQRPSVLLQDMFVWSPSCLVAISFILAWNWGGAESMVGFGESYLTWSGKQTSIERVGSCWTISTLSADTSTNWQTNICCHISHADCSRHWCELHTVIYKFHHGSTSIQSIENFRLWSVWGFFPRGLLEI